MYKSFNVSMWQKTKHNHFFEIWFQKKLSCNENSFTEGFSINCLKEKSVYKITKDFPLTSMANSHNSVISVWSDNFDFSFFQRDQKLSILYVVTGHPYTVVWIGHTG